MGTSLSRSGIGCCRELISLRLHIVDRRARSQRSATSASSINVPEFDVMLREVAWAVPAVLPELLEERLAIGLIELAPPAWVRLHDVRRLPRTTLDGFLVQSGAGLGSSKCIAPPPMSD